LIRWLCAVSNGNRAYKYYLDGYKVNDQAEECFFGGEAEEHPLQRGRELTRSFWSAGFFADEKQALTAARLLHFGAHMIFSSCANHHYRTRTSVHSRGTAA
jgi:hypothetical protein